MEVDHVFEAAKDTGGARTIKAFLDSKASGKQNHRIINKYVLPQYLLFLFFRSSFLSLLLSFLVEQPKELLVGFHQVYSSIVKVFIQVLAVT